MKNNWKERAYCGDLSEAEVNRDVVLMGWVDAVRNHGQLIFIHLRDIRGILQVIFNTDIENLAQAHILKEEFIVEVKGKVRLRESGTENPNLQSGRIEILASELSILSKSIGLPFQITEKAMIYGEDLKSSPENVDEELRLQYRYLDLRRPSIQKDFIARNQIVKTVRKFLDHKNFIELETPVLTKSTPEGARDFLVPSRIHPGRFYALPQSPQLFKQIFMMSGFERYFQIVKCFRDEDLRPNRQPEFTQLDVEAAFIDEEFIFELIEELMIEMFAVGGIALSRPFPRMTFQEALDRYGTDRPDLRVSMDFRTVTEIFQNTNYTIFKRVIQSNGHIKGFCIRGKSKDLTKNILQNEYAMKIAPAYGAQGMSWMRMINGKLESNIVQFFSIKEQKNLIETFQIVDKDVIILIADTSLELVNYVLNNLRLHIAKKLNLIPQDLYCPVWITDFPLFERDGDRCSSVHHPFTAPDRMDFDPTQKDDLLSLRSRAYDLVVNGEELGGGSIRIHSMDIQKKIFQALDLDEKTVENKFGFFLRALEFGAPPHGGIALGLDRVVSMILGLSSIRDVIPFPKNRRAVCPLTLAPSNVENEQLTDLKLDVGLADADRRKTEGPIQKQRIKDELPTSDRISDSEVRHIARLARLNLEEGEIENLKKDLNSILSYVENLNELNTDDVLPMDHVSEIRSVWREDKPGKSNKAGSILSNAPEQKKGYFRVPKIIEG